MCNQPERRESGEEHSSSIQNVLQVFWIPVSLLYMEITAKLFFFGSVFDSTFVYLLVLALGMGFLLSFVAMMLNGKPRRIYMKTVLTVLAVWFSFHVTYHNNFHTLFSWQSIGQADDVTQFWREAIESASGVWYIILSFFVPLIVMCCLGCALVNDGEKRSVPFSVLSLAAFAGCYFPMLLYIRSTKEQSDGYTPYYYYTYLQNDLDMSFKYYGVFNATRLDMKQMIFGAPVETINADDTDFNRSPAGGDSAQTSVSDADAKREYGYNVMEIDFDKAAASTKNQKLKAMDAYFAGLTPTRKNDYTGIFKGKNLVLITLEAFSDKLIDPDFTPMLYKMSTEGFVFNNFYNTLWGGSTATGEYSILTGNFYSNSSCLPKSANTYQPFTLAHQLSAQGYQCFGYHNNSYRYYDRHLSHPNFGYKWIAIDNGLVLKSQVWPNSDKEMAEATVADYATLNGPFHAYYMSVSGHSGYSFAGNMMATRHREDVLKRVKGFPNDLKAYYACQYEAELMLEVLVDELEKAGNLENTVFALEADHYPYALSTEALAKLYDLPKGGLRYNFELYRNRFILWTPSMTQPVQVDDYCSTIDILPTLSNMFGLEFDSRLMMGKDIMADGDHFALLKVSGWSWVSDQGSYNGSLQKFVPSGNCSLTDKEKDAYIKRVNKAVRAKTTYSPQIIDLDYYGHLFGKKRK